MNIVLNHLSPMHLETVLTLMAQLPEGSGVERAWLQGPTATFRVTQPTDLGDAIAKVYNRLDLTNDEGPLARLVWNLYKRTVAWEKANLY